MNDDQEVARLRERLQAYFREQAVGAGIKLRPTNRNPSDTVLAERLYEEKKGTREFLVSPLDRPALDAFVKKTGINYEIDLLQVLVGNGDFARIWVAYVAWLHNNLDEESVLTLLKAREG